MNLGIFKKLVHLQDNLKLRSKLMISFSLLAILPVVAVGAMSTFYSNKYLIQAETNALTQSMYQLNNSLDYFFQTYMDRTNMVFNSEDLQELIQTDAESIDTVMGLNKKMNKLLSYIETDFTYPEMNKIFVSGSGNITSKLYLDNDSVTSYGVAEPISNIMNQAWVQNLFMGERAFVWHNGEVIKGNSTVSLTRRLVNFDNGKDAGLLQLFIPISRVSNIIKYNLKNNNMGVFYLDENLNKIAAVGDTKYCSDIFYHHITELKLTEGVNIARMGNEDVIMGYMSSGSTKWKVVYIIPLKRVTDKTRIIRLITIVAICVALIFCVLIAYGVSTIITHRIKILLEKTKAVDENNLNTTLIVGGNDELSQLDRNFDRMVARIRNLIENVYKAQIITNQTKLELLQEQINPHLLYNTLSMVAETAAQKHQQDITDVAENLSAFYRGVLNRGKMICIFKEEIDMVKRYIEIAKYVYKLDIEVILEIEEEILEVYTIKLLIEPIVENSILHGIRPKKHGIISISGGIVKDEIRFFVSDDGIGIDESVINQLNGITSKSKFDKSYGITNVNRRIKMLLGDRYGLEYTSTLNEGTTVKLNLPKLSFEEANTLLK